MIQTVPQSLKSETTTGIRSLALAFPKVRAEDLKRLVRMTLAALNNPSAYHSSR